MRALGEEEVRPCACAQTKRKQRELPVAQHQLSIAVLYQTCVSVAAGVVVALVAAGSSGSSSVLRVRTLSGLGARWGTMRWGLKRAVVALTMACSVRREGGEGCTRVLL